MSKANGKKTFQAAGKSYSLQYDINAICALEDVYGKGISEIGGMLREPDLEMFDGDELKLAHALVEFKPPKMSDVRNIFHAGLLEYHEGISLTEAGAVMQKLGIALASEYCFTAFGAAFPDEDEDKKKGKGAKPDPKNKK